MAILAVNSLRQDAIEKKNELGMLNAKLRDLKEDKQSLEKTLELDEGSFSRILTRAISKGRVRGIIEGILVGLVTGIVSSILVNYFL